MRRPDTQLLRQLQVADQRFLRIWFLSRPLQWTGALVLSVRLGALGYASALSWATPISTNWGQILMTLFAILLGATAWKPVVRLLHVRKTFQDLLIDLGMAVLGSFLAKLHVRFFEKEFLEQGSLSELHKQP